MRWLMLVLAGAPVRSAPTHAGDVATMIDPAPH
jgi:hypothetical protein